MPELVREREPATPVGYGAVVNDGPGLSIIHGVERTFEISERTPFDRNHR